MPVMIVLDLPKKSAMNVKKITEKMVTVHVRINAVIWSRSIKTRTQSVAIVVQSVNIAMAVVIVSASYV